MKLRRLNLAGRGSFLSTSRLDREALREVIRAHRDNKEPERCLKRNRGTLVTVVHAPARGCGPEAAVPVELVVKEVPLPLIRRVYCRLGGTSVFAREFQQVERLGELGLPAPTVVACSLRPRGSCEFLITEFAPGLLTLRDLLWLGDSVVKDLEERRRLLASIGAWLRHVHDLGVWQRDMKPSNVLLKKGEAWDPGRAEGVAYERSAFFLVDVTAVRFRGRPLEAWRRVRNLCQILDLPAALDPVARTPLLEAYLGQDVADLDSWLRRVDLAIEARRDSRQAGCGFRHVDEEHWGLLARRQVPPGVKKP